MKPSYLLPEQCLRAELAKLQKRLDNIKDIREKRPSNIVSQYKNIELFNHVFGIAQSRAETIIKLYENAIDRLKTPSVQSKDENNVFSNRGK